jgi:predicted N-formylglutamate amidohydrolase
MNSPTQNANPPFISAHLAGDMRFLILCDHASNYMPPEFDNLGLTAAQCAAHIAYDPGAFEVASLLAEHLQCPLLASQFSRLLIEPNRGLDDPTLVMKLSDGSIIPGNRRVDPYQDKAAWQSRIARFYQPYDDAIGAAIERAQAQGVAPIILSIHSFTPIWRGTARPWQASVLWDKDPRVADLMGRFMADFEGLVFGDNEPYTGRRAGETLHRHATKNGLAHAIVELRQDEIKTAQQHHLWASRLAEFLKHALTQPDLTKAEHYGSMTDPQGPLSGR